MTKDINESLVPSIFLSLNRKLYAVQVVSHFRRLWLKLKTYITVLFIYFIYLLF